MDADSAVARLAAIATALEAVAAALRSANPDALSACEPPLEAALSRVPTPSDLAGCPAGALTTELHRIQSALERCRTLGRATAELVTSSLSAQGIVPGYGPVGVGAPVPRLGRLEVRV